MTRAADVAAVLDDAAVGKFGAWLGTCPICLNRKGTQIYKRDDGLMVIDCSCRCGVTAVRASVMARYFDYYGKEMTELLTPSQATAKAANGRTGGNDPLGRDR